jgi:hypothetical protein
VLKHPESSFERFFETFCGGGAAAYSAYFNHSRDNAAVREWRERSRGQFYLYHGPVEHAVNGSVVKINNGRCRDGYITGQQVLIGVIGCISQGGRPLFGMFNWRQGRRFARLPRNPRRVARFNADVGTRVPPAQFTPAYARAAVRPLARGCPERVNLLLHSPRVAMRRALLGSRRPRRGGSRFRLWPRRVTPIFRAAAGPSLCADPGRSSPSNPKRTSSERR